MKKLATIIALGMSAALIGASAHAISIPAKAKAGKVQGNLVPAFYPLPTMMGGNTSGTGDDEDDSPAIIKPAGQRSGFCTFTQGKFKAQVGKDAAVQLKGVTCSMTYGGAQTPYTGSLCAQTKVLATIMDTDITKSGGTAAFSCMAGGLDIAGLTNFSTGNIGTISCSNGTCKGTMAVVTSDPCPSVDKVAEVRRLEVFDGPAFGSNTIMGTPLRVCCGPKQTYVGPVASTGGAGGCAVSTTTDEANGGTQDVLGEIGTLTQGVP